MIRAIDAKDSLEMASKTLQRIGAVFRFAVQTGRATFNPAADMRGALKAKKVEHHTMIPPEELPDFLKSLTAGDIHITTKCVIQFTILTAARSGEVRRATWAEIRQPTIIPPCEVLAMAQKQAKVIKKRGHKVFRHNGIGFFF